MAPQRRIAYVPTVGRPERFDLEHRDLVRGASAEQRLLAAIHRHFRRRAGSPSYGELNADTGIAISNIGRHLDRLQLSGYLQHTRGRARSIVLLRRGAGLSDIELELECHARAWTVTGPHTSVAALVEAYPVPDSGTDCKEDMIDLLGQIDAAEEEQHGPGKAT